MCRRLCLERTRAGRYHNCGGRRTRPRLNNPVPSPYQRHRVLYVGQNYALLAALQAALADLNCPVIRCPGHGVPEARAFIRSEIPYTLFLFDEHLTDSTGEELARYTLSLPHRTSTPTLIARNSDAPAALAHRIRRLLAARD